MCNKLAGSVVCTLNNTHCIQPSSLLCDFDLVAVSVHSEGCGTKLPPRTGSDQDKID